MEEVAKGTGAAVKAEVSLDDERPDFLRVPSCPVTGHGFGYVLIDCVEEFDVAFRYDVVARADGVYDFVLLILVTGVEIPAYLRTRPYSNTVTSYLLAPRHPASNSLTVNTHFAANCNAA